MTETAIVILNYNGKKWLEKFLPTFILYSEEAPIYVADNQSTDHSVNWLIENYPEVKVLVLEKNYGFAEGYNRALREIEAEIYVIVNSDVEVSEGWLSPCVQLLHLHHDIAACQPKILDYNNKTYFEYAGGAGGYIDKYGYPFCRGRIFSTCEEDKGQYNDTRPIFWASGACLFIKSSIFHTMQGFDDTFFAHNEEIDLCWRLQIAGYSIYYCAESTIYHVGGGTLNKRNPFKTYLNIRNNRTMLYKLKNEAHLFKVLLVRNFLDFLLMIKMLLGGNIREAQAILNGWWDYVKRKPNTKRIVHRKYLNTIYRQSVVWQYFFKGRKTYTALDGKL